MGATLSEATSGRMATIDSLLATDVEDSLPSREDRRTLLASCASQFRKAMHDLVRESLAGTDDLFEFSEHVRESDAAHFKHNRDAWLEKFDTSLAQLIERRTGGERRKGRRPDFDASVSTLQVLTAFDQQKQTALHEATAFLTRITQRELAALDLRVEVLFDEASTRDIDNPLGPPYLLDAIGVSARTVYPNPRVWRSLMERIVVEIAPGVNRAYIALNRFLADRNVLPEIKAALRARSEHRPADDKDLLPAFSRLFAAVGPLPTDIEVPPAFAPLAAAVAAAPAHSDASQSAGFVPPHPAAAGIPAAGVPPGFPTPPAQPPVDGLFPSLDPMMALGSSTPLFAALTQWQRMAPVIVAPATLPAPMPAAMPAGMGSVVVPVPLNQIPLIRAAIEDKISSPTDRVTMDVIGLLFDYIFRDASIPDSLRAVFAPLQAPVVKAALLDRAFFADRKHPTRMLLDRLAAAAVGATSDPAYLEAFETLAEDIVGEICRDFEIDVDVFKRADERLRKFIEAEHAKTETAATDDVATALAAEEREADRALVLTDLRDKLAGVRLPFDVRSFLETTWADYMTSLRQRDGADSASYRGALQVLDDLLWSIIAHERTSQKARLAKMIPSLIARLRAGSSAQQADSERAKSFFETLYELHIAAIKPPATAAKPDAAPVSAANEPAAPAESPETGPMTIGGLPATTNVHDYVAEMAAGTWLSFTTPGGPVIARLHWISPMRTKYVFTSRSRSRAFVFTPEELAWEIGAAKARLVVEPVPLFDRAVSAALDSLAAKQPKGKAAA
jgi:hypothetical protein